MQLLQESLFESKIICEAIEGHPKTWFLEGIYAQAEVGNGNGRFYPFPVLEGEVLRFNEEKIKTNTAVGELMHPEKMIINYDRVTHKIEKLLAEGNNFLGKSKILNTPCGKILQGLLEGGVKMGNSTRGYGTVKKRGKINEVQNDYRMVTIDVVGDPSAPGAFAQALMEGKGQVWNQSEPDIIFLESLKEGIKKTNSKLLEAKMLDTFRIAMAKIGKK